MAILECSEEHNAIKKVWRLPVDDKRSRGRRRVRMRDVVRRDMEVTEGLNRKKIMLSMKTYFRQDELAAKPSSFRLTC